MVVENFRPGTMEKLGYGWETLHARYPKLIYAAASGFGHSGPSSKEPAYDMVVQGLGGIMSITGHPGQPPVRIGMSIGDIGARALHGRRGQRGAAPSRAHGRGDQGRYRHVRLSSWRSSRTRSCATRSPATCPGPLGARHPSITPFEAFATASGSIIIAAGNDGLFQKLCAAIGRPDLAAHPNYRSNDLRNTHQAALKAEIERELKKKPAEEWIAIIGKGGVPCGPINTVDRALAHPQVAARNMLVTVEDPKAGTLKLVGNPLKLSAFADPPTRAPRRPSMPTARSCCGSLGSRRCTPSPSHALRQAQGMGPSLSRSTGEGQE